MLSPKIRIIVPAVAAVAALSIPGAASAAMLMRSPATVTQAPVKAPSTIVAREAGSAGVKGYDNEKCESVKQEASNAAYNQIHFTANGNFVLGTYYGEVANQKNQELTENCLVVD